MTHPTNRPASLKFLLAWSLALLVTLFAWSASAEEAVSRPLGDQNLVAGRAFLLPDQPEGAGYGRYSYLLFTEPPDAGNRDLYQSLLDTYLGRFDQAIRLEKEGVSRLALDLILLPLRTAPPDSPTPAWLLAHYDFPRARAIQAKLGELGGGPAYVVAYGTPLSGVTQVDTGRLVVEDISGTGQKPAAIPKPAPPPPEKANGDDAAWEETVRSGARLTGRAFLAAGENEGEGYGLYSYVLFAAPVHAGNRALYAAVLEAYLGIRDIGRFEAAGAERETLNVTYLPVRQPVPKETTPAWLLAHYDFVRAQLILRVLENPGGGPYILSYSAPLTSATEVDRRRLLVQDLSAVPADLAFLWVKEFITQARQPQYWDAPTLRRFMLNLRTHIAVMARAFVEVRSAHADVTSFLEGKIRLRE